MMTLKKLAKKCRKCPFTDKCDHKQMEALGCFPELLVTETKSLAMAEMAAPILRETVNAIVDGKVVTMYKDELEKILYKDLYSHLGLQFGG